MGKDVFKCVVKRRCHEQRAVAQSRQNRKTTEGVKKCQDVGDGAKWFGSPLNHLSGMFFAVRSMETVWILVRQVGWRLGG